MKKRQKYKKRSPKGLLKWGLAAGLSLSTGVATAAGQIAVVTNDTNVEQGEQFGATVVLNGDGRYDVYVGLTGGVLGSSILAFDAEGNLVPWDGTGLPAKLRDNVDLASLSVKEKIISLFARMPLDGLAGSYTFYGALGTPGQLEFPIVDVLEVEVK